MKTNIKRKSIAISMPLAFIFVIGILISSCQKKIDQPTEVGMVNNSSDYFKVSQEQFQQHKSFLTIINNH